MSGRADNRLLSLAWPAMLEMLLYMLVLFVDTLMISPLGPAALAAAGIANQIFSILVLLLSVVATGCNVLVAHASGANLPAEAKQVAEQSLFASFLIAAGVTAAITLTTPWMMALFQAQADVQALGAPFLRILAWSIPFLALSMTLGAYLRGKGDMKTPMLAAFFTNLFNVAGNLVFIHGVGPIPALGIDGSALATLLARMAGLALLFLLLYKRHHAIGSSMFRLSRHRPDVYRRLLSIGGPAALQQAGYHAGQMVMVIIIAMIGTTAVAARQISMSVESLSFLPGFGIGLAITSLVGLHLGAGSHRRCYEEAASAIRLGVSIMGSIGLALFLSAEWLVGMFTADQTVFPLAVLCLKIMAFAQPAKAANMILDGIFRGAAKTRWSLYVTLAGVWMWGLPLAYAAGVRMEWGLPAVFVVLALEEWLRAGANTLYFVKRKWLIAKPTKSG
jgi:putative MATE family efflux protein